MVEQDSISSREVAVCRFSAIASFAIPAEFPLVSAQFKRKRVLLARTLAQQAGRSQRTIYRWRKLWRDGGLTALERRRRSDRGRPRSINHAAAEFLLQVSVAGRGSVRIAAAYRSYVTESRRRQALAGHRITDRFDQARYAAWLDCSGRLRDQAQLPAITYETIRSHWRHMPEIALWFLCKRDNPSNDVGGKDAN